MKSLRSRIRKLRRAGVAIAATAAVSSTAFASQKPRVVLIHGIWDTSRTLGWMDKAIREAGFETLLIRLRPNDGSARLDELASQVNREIESRFGDSSEFSIVGMSMGGLVARSYLKQFGDPSRIPVVVTIGSPHRGTLLAGLSLLPGVKDMRPGSRFLQSLEENQARFTKTKWVTIRTPLDLMILPSQSSELPWADNYTIPVIAHPLLAYDPRVIDCTLRALGVSTKSEPAGQASRHAGSLPRRIPGIRQLPSASPGGQ